MTTFTHHYCDISVAFDDCEAHLSDRSEAAFDDVAGSHGADARGRAGEDDVAAFQSEVLARPVYEEGDAEQHVTRVTLLAHRTVHLIIIAFNL